LNKLDNSSQSLQLRQPLLTALTRLWLLGNWNIDEGVSRRNA
jgi:hypothetical protein